MAAKKKKKTARSSRQRSTSPPVRSKRTRRIARTQEALAAYFDRSRSTVRNWFSYDEWRWGSRGPFPLDEIEREFIPTLGRTPTDVGVDKPELHANNSSKESTSGSAISDPLKVARLLKVRQETEKLKRQNKLFDALYVDRAAARAEISSVIHNTRTAIIAEARSAAAALDSVGHLADGTKADVERILTERAEALCRRFADGLRQAIERKR